MAFVNEALFSELGDRHITQQADGSWSSSGPRVPIETLARFLEREAVDVEHAKLGLPIHLDPSGCEGARRGRDAQRHVGMKNAQYESYTHGRREDPHREPGADCSVERAQGGVGRRRQSRRSRI